MATTSVKQGGVVDVAPAASSAVTTAMTAPPAIKKQPSMIWNIMRDVTAGTCGGIAVTLVGHPFDTLKVRLQTQSSTKPVYSGVVDCFMKTLRWEGVGGLYKGVTSPLVGQMFFRSVLFTAYGQSKDMLLRKRKSEEGAGAVLRASDYFVAGGITGFCAAFAEGPIDFYKSQMQVQIVRAKADPSYKPPFEGIQQCVRQSVQYNGFRGAPYIHTYIRSHTHQRIPLSAWCVQRQHSHLPEKKKI